jgi:hypothetical protein
VDVAVQVQSRRPQVESAAVELREAFGGRWWALIIGVPLAAAVLAGALFVQSDAGEVRASAVLSLQDVTSATGASEIRAAFDDFDSALESSEVATTVSAIAPDGAESIEASRVGEGGDVVVSFVAPNAEEASTALEAGVREALTLLSEAERRSVARQLVSADALASDSVGVLLEIEASAGAADLAEESARRSADLLSLRNQIAAAEGDPQVQAALSDTLAQKEVEQAAISDALLPWTNQRARFDLGVSSGAAAALRLQQIATNQVDLRDAPIFRSAQLVEESSLPVFVRTVVAAAVVAALIVVVLAIMFSVRGNRSRDRSETDGLPRPS